MDLIKDLDQLQKNPILHSAITCRVKLILSALEKPEAEALEAALSNTEISATSLTKLLQGHGHQVSIDSIRRHRRRHDQNAVGCQCP